MCAIHVASTRSSTLTPTAWPTCCSSLHVPLFPLPLLRVGAVVVIGLKGGEGEPSDNGEIFVNFTNQKQFVKILPSKCLFSIGIPYNP